MSIAKHDLKVTVLAWDRDCSSIGTEVHPNRTIYRFRFRAPTSKFYLAIYYPFFWLWVFYRLILLKPTVIHACDIDSSPPSLAYRLLNSDAKIIFDVFDTYSLIIQKRSKFLSKIVAVFERYVASVADVFITVSENRLSFFRNIAFKEKEIIMNCPPKFSRSLQPLVPKKINKFTLVYSGQISQDRGLLETAEALSCLQNVEFFIAGRVVDPAIMEKLTIFPFVTYFGQLTFVDSLRLQKSADLIPLLYDPTEPLNRVASPNKLYEAMMLGIPIITNLSNDLIPVKIGLTVDYFNVNSISTALLYLRDHPKECQVFALAGTSAFEKYYNWEVMEKKLISIYNRLLDEK